MKVRKDWVDYSEEVKLVQSRTLRLLLVTSSGFFLALGFIGLFLPVLPTTPFVLLAASCYARSSSTFYNWLMNHHLFGEALRQWVEYRCIKRKSKILAICLLWASLLPSIYWVVPVPAVKFALAFIGLAVSIFIGSRPSETIQR